MPLSRTPLFAAHAALGAQFIEIDGWLLPGAYRTVEEEVAAAGKDAVVVDLAAHGALTLSGPDVKRFCNGMFTQNIRAMDEGRTARSALTDEKGKMLGLISVSRIAAETMLVLLDGVTNEFFTERYGKYIILDDVEMDDLSESNTVLHVAGPRAAAALAMAALPVPLAGECVAAGSMWLLARERYGLPGFDIVVPKAECTTLFEALRGVGVLPIGYDAAEWLRIGAGEVRWPVDMGERALVHEMNLVASCCSFDKGCYVGQEVINRIDVMGQVNKKIVLLQMDEDAIPPLGAEVRLGDDVIGTARSGARLSGKSRILAVVRKAAWAPGTAVTVHADGRSVGATVL
jgi:folate-binding protein YgfZ